MNALLNHRPDVRLLAVGAAIAAAGLASLGLFIGRPTSTLAAPPPSSTVVAKAGGVVQLSGPVTIQPGDSITLPGSGLSLDLRACRNISVIFAPTDAGNAGGVNAALHTFATAPPEGFHAEVSGVWASGNEETFLISQGPGGFTSAPIVTPYGWIHVYNVTNAPGGTPAPRSESRIDLFCGA